MIRKTLLTLFLLTFLASCDNDLEITSDWKDIPVVYGILNSQDSVNYVKLNKAFLGQGDVMMMAQELPPPLLRGSGLAVALAGGSVVWLVHG